jgi:adenosine deaminase
MTHEYLKGAEEQNLSYSQLKKMARTSLEHAFIGGASLWRDGKAFTAVKECGSENAGATQPSASCQKFLEGSGKARLQWNLEAEFRQFEANSRTAPNDGNTAADREKISRKPSPP